MNAFIVAMIVVMFNGVPQYWYNINETNPHPSMFSCETQIADNRFQQQVLQRFNSNFRNRVAMIRLACIPKEKVAEYKIWAEEKNNANREQ